MNIDNNNYSNKIRAVMLTLLMAVGLASCVTTETGMFTKKTDEKKALEHSVQLAKRYMSERKWDLAKRHLKAALEMDDESAEVNEAMALVFQNTGEFERAESHYKKALQLDENLARARLNYGSFLYSHKRYKDAVTQLTIVVEDTLYERRYTAFINLGRSQYALLEYEQSEKSFRTAYMMRDRHHPALIIRLAQVYYYLGRYPLSQQYFDDYSKRVKTKSATALLLGARLAKQFEDKNAISSYGLALKNLYPRSQQFLDYQQEFVHGS